MTLPAPSTDPVQFQELVEHLVQRVHPRKVVLFGSHAYGQPHEGSDVDVLVVVPHPPPRRERWKIASELRPYSAGPLQLVFMSPEEFEETKDVVGGIAYPAVHWGKSLYEATR
jgi:predicted nucleotidyltransferase